jgi:hypothetical protein
VGPRDGLDVCEESRPHWDSIPGPSSPWSVAIPTELPRPHYLYYNMEVNFALFTPYRRMGSRGITPFIFISVLNGGELIVS